MFAKLSKQCDYCSSNLYIEKHSDVKDKEIDGRRHISCICPVCGETLKIIVRMVPKGSK